MPLDVRPVRSRRELNTFIKLPFRLYRDEPNWVPPLIAERRQFLDRSRNPFFEHGEAEYFLAWRDGRAVGRISAQVDHNLHRFQIRPPKNLRKYRPYLLQFSRDLHPLRAV